uniref:Uncharacterized protein n=1 Tax=mine drainage metagenome TaxID=410659 RepID=E6PQ89_9ZZZZ
MTNPIEKHRQQVARTERDLLQMRQRINDVTVKTIVTEAHRQGSSPHAIAGHTGLTLGQVRNILNLPN